MIQTLAQRLSALPSRLVGFKRSHPRGALVVGVLSLLFIAWLFWRFVGVPETWRFIRGQYPTQARIYVEPPQVYTRERLVNDRFRELTWLEDRLDNLKSTAERSESVRSSMSHAQQFAFEQGDTAPFPDASADKQTPSGGTGPQLDQNDAFDLDYQRRVAVRSEIMNTLLDDGHDLAGSTLYRLNFDVSVIPRQNARGFGLIAIDVAAPGCGATGRGLVCEADARRLAQRVLTYRSLLGDWERELQNFLSKVYRDRVGTSPGTSLIDPFAGGKAPKERMAFNWYLKAQTLETFLDLTAGLDLNRADCRSDAVNRASDRVQDDASGEMEDSEQIRALDEATQEASKRGETWNCDSIRRRETIRQTLGWPGSATRLAQDLSAQLQRGFSNEIEHFVSEVRASLQQQELGRFISEFDSVRGLCRRFAVNSGAGNPQATERCLAREQAPRTLCQDLRDAGIAVPRDASCDDLIGWFAGKHGSGSLVPSRAQAAELLSRIAGSTGCQSGSANPSWDLYRRQSTRVPCPHPISPEVANLHGLVQLAGRMERVRLALLSDDRARALIHPLSETQANSPIAVRQRVMQLYMCLFESGLLTPEAAFEPSDELLENCGALSSDIGVPKATLLEDGKRFVDFLRRANWGGNNRSAQQPLEPDPSSPTRAPGHPSFRGSADPREPMTGASDDGLGPRLIVRFDTLSPLPTILLIDENRDIEAILDALIPAPPASNDSTVRSLPPSATSATADAGTVSAPTTGQFAPHPGTIDRRSISMLFEKKFADFFVDRLRRNDIPGYYPSPPVDRFLAIRTSGCEGGSCDVLVTRKHWLTEDVYRSIGEELRRELDACGRPAKRRSSVVRSFGKDNDDRSPSNEACMSILRALLPDSHRQCEPVEKRPQQQQRCYDLLLATLDAAEQAEPDRSVLYAMQTRSGHNQFSRTLEEMFDERIENRKRALCPPVAADAVEETCPDPYPGEAGLLPVDEKVIFDFTNTVNALEFARSLEALSEPADVKIYAVEPRTQGTKTRADIRRSEQVRANLRASVGPLPDASLRGIDNLVQRLERVSARNTVIGFGHLRGGANGSEQRPSGWTKGQDPRRVATFGWMFLPNRFEPAGRYGSGVRATHTAGSYRLSAVLSLPSWWTEVKLTLRQCWGRFGHMSNAVMAEPYDAQAKCHGGKFQAGLAPAGRTEYRIQLPASTERVTEAFDFEVIKVPYIDGDSRDPPEVEAGRKGQIVIEGGRLWRGTMVTLGDQSANEIAVLPDMRGVVAKFDCVLPPPGRHHFTDRKTSAAGSRARPDPIHGPAFRKLNVWTAQGHATTTARVWPFKQRTPEDRPCWLAPSEKMDNAFAPE